MLSLSRTGVIFKTIISSTVRKRGLHLQDKHDFDIIIAGGGMVGTTLACTLAKNPKLSEVKILLLEGGPDKVAPVGEKYSNRVSALNPQTKRLLEQIGVWKHIEQNRFAPVKKLQVWDGVSNAMITLNDDCSETAAYIVENDLLLNSVGKELSNLSNLSVVHNAKISEYHLPLESEFSNVKLENGNSYQGKLLFGCDGANSKVRDAMGTHYLSWNYNEFGVVATLTLTEETENIIAWQRFLPNGTVALLPLTNKLSSLVWSTTTENAKRLLTLTEEEFVEAVNNAIWKEHKSGEIIKRATESVDGVLKFFKLPSNAVRQLPPTIAGCEPKSRAAFPLGFGHASNYVTKGVALVGDAAHRMHPLAGQGVNLGFGDIVTLDALLGESVYSGQELGNFSVLKRYESERQKHNLPTMMAVDSLQKLYNTDFTPVVLLRSVGLQVTNALTPLKKLIVNQAST